MYLKLYIQDFSTLKRAKRHLINDCSSVPLKKHASSVSDLKPFTTSLPPPFSTEQLEQFWAKSSHRTLSQASANSNSKTSQESTNTAKSQVLTKTLSDNLKTESNLKVSCISEKNRNCSDLTQSNQGSFL